MTNRCLRLVASSPKGPGDDEGLLRWREDEDPGEEIADFRDAGDHRRHADQAAIGLFGLVSFGLLPARRRRSADSLARNARAAMHRLMWRCHPYQERASQ